MRCNLVGQDAGAHEGGGTRAGQNLVSRVENPAHKQADRPRLSGAGRARAYHAGVYQPCMRPARAGLIIGTIHWPSTRASLPVNEPENRLERLRNSAPVTTQRIVGLSEKKPPPGRTVRQPSYWSTSLRAEFQCFFEPNPLALLGAHYPLGRDKPATIQPRARKDVDNSSTLRSSSAARRGSTSAAPHVRTSEMRYSSTAAIRRFTYGSTCDGICARPPPFPPFASMAILWDGGILRIQTNRGIFDDNPAPETP